MTDKEIEKLLSMCSKGNLKQIREYLKKEKNLSVFRQEIFEQYLMNNKFGFDKIRMPKLLFEDNIQYFTNGVSLYQINSEFLKINTSNLSLQKNKNRELNHRFEIKDIDHFNTYFKCLIENYGSIDSYCDSFSLSEDKLYTFVDYVDIISGEIVTRRFDTSEINISNIILKNPTYKISNSFPILHAENDIGKVYILGYKNTKKE